MFSDELLERIFCDERMKDIPLCIQSTVVHVVEDSREGKSGMSRKTYMESKQMYSSDTPENKQHKMRDLETYMRELSDDVTEMISDSTPEEKTMLKTKLQTLVQHL